MFKKFKLNNFPTNPLGEVTSNQIDMFIVEGEAGATLLIKSSTAKYEVDLSAIDDAAFEAYFEADEVVEEEPEVPGDDGEGEV